MDPTFEAIIENPSGYLTDRLLLATPSVQDGCFNKAVIYICAHNESGAMGVIVNSALQSIHLDEIMEQLSIPMDDKSRDLPIHFGGPVEAHRGFVLHSSDIQLEDTLSHASGISLTSNVNILKAIAGGTGPSSGLLILGYAGWAPGQLEAEIEAGSWIILPATKQVVFETDNDNKWNLAAGTLGIDFGRLSYAVGHA